MLSSLEASDPGYDEHIQTTEELLVQLGLERVPRLTIFNKADRIDPEHRRGLDRRPETITSCALVKEGLSDLYDALMERFGGLDAFDEDASDEAGATDGFVIGGTHMPGSFEDFVELVVPELQRRGLFRTEYTASTLRGHLGMSVPERGAWQR